MSNPPLDSPIRRLRYIGPYLSDRFNGQGITTLRDLRDTVSDQTRAQNTRLLRNALENRRKQQCVGVPRYNRETDSYSKYCVRRENNKAWTGVVNYLINHDIPPEILPEAEPPRGQRERCQSRRGCASINPVDALPERYERIPYNTLEHIVINLLKANNVAMTAVKLHKKSRERQVQSRNFSSVLKGNTGEKGRQLFQKSGVDAETGKPKYKLRTPVYNLLRTRTNAQVLDYVRKL